MKNYGNPGKSSKQTIVIESKEIYSLQRYLFIIASPMPSCKDFFILLVRCHFDLSEIFVISLYNTWYNVDLGLALFETLGRLLLNQVSVFGWKRTKCIRFVRALQAPWFRFSMRSSSISYVPSQIPNTQIQISKSSIAVVQYTLTPTLETVHYLAKNAVIYVPIHRREFHLTFRTVCKKKFSIFFFMTQKYTLTVELHTKKMPPI